MVEAARVMLLVEKSCEPYAPPAEVPAEAKASLELEVASAEGHSRLVVRGRNYSPGEDGLNMVVLDHAFAVEYAKNFAIQESAVLADRLRAAGYEIV